MALWSRCSSSAAEIEFHGFRDHDNGLPFAAIFKHRVAHGFCAIDKQAAAGVVLVLNDPMSAAVPADVEDQRRLTRRRFMLAHSRLPIEFYVGGQMTRRAVKCLREEVGFREGRARDVISAAYMKKHGQL